MAMETSFPGGLTDLDHGFSAAFRQEEAPAHGPEWGATLGLSQGGDMWVIDILNLDIHNEIVWYFISMIGVNYIDWYIIRWL